MVKNKLKNFKIVLGYKSAIAMAFFIAGMGTMAAFAAIPSSTGVISTCYRNTLLQKTFRVLDTEAGQTCNANETALNFNQTGPQGPQGPAGNGTGDKYLLVNSGPAPDHATQYSRVFGTKLEAQSYANEQYEYGFAGFFSVTALDDLDTPNNYPDFTDTAPSAPGNVNCSYIPDPASVRCMWSSSISDGGDPLIYYLFLNGQYETTAPPNATSADILLNPNPYQPGDTVTINVSAKNRLGSSESIEFFVTFP